MIDTIIGNQKTKKDLTILIIEDQDFFLEIFKISFSEYNVISANTGKKGLDLFQEMKIDIVVLDICLPDISGFEVLSSIIHIAPKAFVLVISALNNDSYIKKCKELGAVGFLSKPYKKEYIEHYIEQYMNNKTIWW